jgi:hypothetical protein
MADRSVGEVEVWERVVQLPFSSKTQGASRAVNCCQCSCSTTSIATMNHDSRVYQPHILFFQLNISGSNSKIACTYHKPTRA